MERTLVYKYIKWLEDDKTTLEDIYKRQDEAKEALRHFTSAEMRSEVKYALRLIDEELADRLGVFPNRKHNGV